MNVLIVSMTPEPERVIHYSGRTTVGKESTDEIADVQQWIRDRIAEGHESVLEHASATFRISGISRYATHQLVRHRIASYTQKSQRYTEDAKPEFVVPPCIANSRELLREFKTLAALSTQVYRNFRKALVPKEDARFVLLGSATTEITVTMNFRAWRNFMKLRTTKHAQWEIRNMALVILSSLKKYAPSCFEDIDQ